MAHHSSGILVYRLRDGEVEVLLAHPGGPFWQRKDLGAWSIPKGELEAGEDPESAARRELEEEVGITVDGPLIDLGFVTQRAGKVVYAWGYEAEFDPERMQSNTFSMEWPPRSGRTAEFPEIDRVAWFSPDVAEQKLNPAQTAFLARLINCVKHP